MGLVDREMCTGTGRVHTLLTCTVSHQAGHPSSFALDPHIEVSRAKGGRGLEMLRQGKGIFLAWAVSDLSETPGTLPLTLERFKLAL